MCFEIKKGAKPWKNTLVYKIVTAKLRSPQRYAKAGRTYKPGTVVAIRRGAPTVHPTMPWHSHQGIYIYRSIVAARKHKWYGDEILLLAVRPKDYIHCGKTKRYRDVATYRRVRVVRVLRSVNYEV
jgi:hypothetical protein